MLNELEIQLIRELQEGLPLVTRPFAAIGERLGISEKQVLQMVQNLRERGIIRRFGATIRHQKIGFVANAMVVWQLEPERTVEMGKRLANCPEVTHCYQRKSNPEWPYQLYSVVHGQTDRECREIAHRIAQNLEIIDYQMIFSIRELKKTSMKYFVGEMEKWRNE